MTHKKFYYTNDLGEPKRIDIGDFTEKGYFFVLWSMRTGDCCGSGYMNKEKMFEFLNHYHIKY